MKRCVLTIFLGLLATMCLAQEVTLLSGLNTRQDVDDFAGSVRSAMVEPASEPVTEGDGAMLIRFFSHPSLESAPYVAVNTRRGGLKYSNWAPYETLTLDLRNQMDEPFHVSIFVKSGEARHDIPVELPPGEWLPVQIAVADLQAAGIDVAKVTALGIEVNVALSPRAFRVVVDNVRLSGTDAEAIGAARAEEDARNELLPAPARPRTEAAQGVIKPEPTGQTFTRTVEAPVIATPEVLVVGGGLAGVAAAVTAARMGAETLLVERSGSLGGMATNGLVPPALNISLTEGIVREFHDRLQSIGGAEQMWSPEIMKHVLLTMMRESGAKLMLYSLAVDAIVEGSSIRGIIVENKSGAQAITADIIVDCTGDGDVAAKAGAPFEIGRGRDDETQTQTLVFLLGNVDTDRLLAVREDIGQMAREAKSTGELKSPYGGAGSAIQPVIRGEHGVVNVNTVNIPEVSGLRIEDLTYSHVEAQREALEIARFYRERVPGCEGCYLLSTAEFIGVRESRRVVGEYVLTGEDVLTGATFDDVIARGFYPIDIHSPDGSGDAAGARLSKPYDIPYRCLVPKSIDSLLVAGRCISADHVAHGSLRVMGTTMPLGEAAGCAAAMSVLKGVQPREIQGQTVSEMVKQMGGLPETSRPIPDNLALATNGTIVTADSVYGEKGGNVPANATDGLLTNDMMSRWLSGDGPEQHWLQLEFTQPTTINRVKVYFFSHARSSNVTQYVPEAFDIQVKNGEQWDTIAQARGNAELEPTVLLEPVTAKIMRILFVGPNPSDNIVRLREIVVH